MFNWSQQGDFIRSGQERSLLFIASIMSFLCLKPVVGRAVAAMFSYAGVMWMLRDYPVHGLQHLLFFLSATVVAYFLARERSLDKILTYLGVFQACIGIAEWSGINLWGYANGWEQGKPTGTFGHETMLGCFLAATLAPALFSRRYAASGVILACALMTGSTMTLVSVVTVLLLFMTKEFGARSAAVVLAGLGIAAGLFFFINPESTWFSSTYRTVFWQMGVEQFWKHPIFGSGPGYWLDNAPIVYGRRVTHLHNEFLELVVEYGAIGGVFGLSAILGWLWRFRLTWDYVFCAAILVNCIGNFPLHIAGIAPLFLMAWVVGLRRFR